MALTLTSCKFCKKPFPSYGGRLCPECIKEIDDGYVVVRNYLYENPGATSVIDIAEQTGVEEDVILYLLKENRLYVKDWSGNSKLCQICGIPIGSGTICPSCSAKMQEKMMKEMGGTAGAGASNAAEDAAKIRKKGARMHVSHNKDE
jgi:predicted amidophosphoribosyltransferase